VHIVLQVLILDDLL